MGGKLKACLAVNGMTQVTITFNLMYKKNQHSNHGIDDAIHRILLADEQQESQHDKPNLLLTNDTHFLLMGYKEKLKQHFEVHQVENGLQAVQVVESKPSNFFAVIILDINMPIMNGLDACKRIF